MKKIIFLIIFCTLLINASFFLSGCVEPPAETIAIQYKSFIEEGKQEEEYDFSKCFYAEEGVSYSIKVAYVIKENGDLVEKEIVPNGLKFIQFSYADVYVKLIATKGKTVVTGEEVVVKIVRSGDERQDMLNLGSVPTDFVTVWVPDGDRLDLSPNYEFVNTSKNSIKARKMEFDTTQTNVETYFELSLATGWHSLNLSDSVYQIDVCPINRSNKAIFKFEADTRYFGNFVEVELGANKQGAGWKCDTINGKEGWYHVEIVLKDANINKFEIDEFGACGAVGATVQTFGVDEIWKNRIEVPFEGDPNKPSALIIDNLMISNIVANENLCSWKFPSKYKKISTQLHKGVVTDDNVSGGYSGIVSKDTTETCNSGSSLKLSQGANQTVYPTYWIDLTKLSATGGALDLSNAVLEFDVKLLFDTIYSFDFDFMDIPNNASKATSLWLGNKVSPVINTAATYNSSGITVTKVEGKANWYHVKLEFAKSNINNGNFNMNSVGYLRLMCMTGGIKDVGTTLCYVDNILMKEF